MKRLTEKEEAIMQIIWSKDRAFAKEVRKLLPDPKPHINTVSTTIRKLVDKGFLKIEDFGTTHRYFPAISKEAYTKQFIKPMLTSMFGNSIKNVVAFFAKDEALTAEDMKEIIDMIEKKK